MGVPNEGQELQLTEVLEKAGTLAPQMLKRFYKKDSSNRAVMASVEDKEFIEIQASGHLIFVMPASGLGLGARTIMRNVAPVEQPSTVTIDRHGDEQMVPAALQEPPTKKVAMPGVPIPSGLREVVNLGEATASSSPSPRGCCSVPSRRRKKSSEPKRSR